MTKESPSESECSGAESGNEKAGTAMVLAALRVCVF